MMIFRPWPTQEYRPKGKLTVIALKASTKLHEIGILNQNSPEEPSRQKW